MEKLIWDVEVFPNFFCVCFEDYKSDKTWYFEYSKWQDDRDLLKKFVYKKLLIGYNNIGYDNLILNFILKNDCTNLEIYEFSQDVINNKYENIKKYKYNNNYQSIDVMRLMFSSALRVSLKVLQVGINWPFVKESDIDFHTKVKESDRDEIKAYCMNDVSSTKQITHLNKDALNLRALIEKSFGIKCTSMDGMSTGVALFAKFYAQDSGDDSFLEKKTERLIIALKDCISDKVVFKSEKFNDLLNTLKNKMISQTKGALNYKVLYGDVMYVFGTGGLHSKDKPGVIIPNEDEILEDADVGSLYPSLLINEKACPEHLDPDKFLPRFTWLRDARIHAKKNKQTLIADTFKLSLNGTYGNLINEYSWLYDPQAAMTINKVVVNKRG